MLSPAPAPREAGGGQTLRTVRMTSTTVGEATPAAGQVLKVGERELQEHIADGYRFLLVAGIPTAGKTQLLASFEDQRARQGEGTFLDRFARKEDRVVATSPGTLNCYPIPGTRRMFVDASGEDFRDLYPHRRETGRVEEGEVRFLRTLVKHLDGLVLLLDLRRMWHPEGTELEKKDQMEQVEILTWILMLLRWLEFDGVFPQDSSQSFVDYVNRQVQAFQGKRLRAPVSLLFSRADEALNLKIPAENLAGQGAWLGASSGERILFPPEEERPFFFAYHCLRKLYGALLGHTRHFRVDFVHSMRVHPGTGAVVDPNPLGLFPSLQWLLEPRWQRSLTLPTRHLVAWQRRWDGLTGRGRRWRRLPDRVKVKR